MEIGNLYIEEVPGSEKPFDIKECEQKLRSKGAYHFGFYQIISSNNRTSRWKWLANDKTRDVRVVFKPEENGILSVWDFPVEEERFVIGAIGAIDAENKYSFATALNSRTLSQSIELSAKLSPDLFAIEIFKLGVWLNCARIGYERSGQRHGLTLQQALIAGNPQHNVTSYTALLHVDIPSEYGFELKEDNKESFFDNLLVGIRQGKIKLNSEKLINELRAPSFLAEGEKTDLANRAYAMAICYEMARLYPYRKLNSPPEFCKSEFDPLAEENDSTGYKVI